MTISCPKCGAGGECVWEGEDSGPYLVSLSAPFYERLKNRHPFNVEIVCHQCGTAQIELVPRLYR
jgi:hypothetical protein